MPVLLRIHREEQPAAVWRTERLALLPVTIGAAPSCDVRLEEPGIASHQITLRREASALAVVEEGAEGVATWVGGIRLAHGAPRLLSEGDVVRLGPLWLRVHIEESGAPPAADAEEMALALKTHEPLATLPAMSLRVVEGPGIGQLCELLEGGRDYVVGRGDGADLALPDANLSREHLVVVRHGGEVLVRDVGSKNGCSLGGIPLEGAAVRWDPAKHLRMGTTVVALIAPRGTPKSDEEEVALLRESASRFLAAAPARTSAPPPPPAPPVSKVPPPPELLAAAVPVDAPAPPGLSKKAWSFHGGLRAASAGNMAVMGAVALLLLACAAGAAWILSGLAR